MRKAGKHSDLSLKAQQREIIKTITCLTGFGKSLVFHLKSDVFRVFDFLECEGPPVREKAITVVISPLNALFLAVSNL